MFFEKLPLAAGLELFPSALEIKKRINTPQKGTLTIFQTKTWLGVVSLGLRD